MKSLITFLLGLVVGAFGWNYWLETHPPTVAQRAGELARETKQQATTSAKEIGEDLSDAGIVARIKGKYLLERDLSTLAISVECTHGRVSLNGVTDSAALSARAVAIARETRGVNDVAAHLTVKQ